MKLDANGKAGVTVEQVRAMAKEAARREAVRLIRAGLEAVKHHKKFTRLVTQACDSLAVPTVVRMGETAPRALWFGTSGSYMLVYANLQHFANDPRVGYNGLELFRLDSSGSGSWFENLQRGLAIQDRADGEEWNAALKEHAAELQALADEVRDCQQKIERARARAWAVAAVCPIPPTALRTGVRAERHFWELRHSDWVRNELPELIES